jgi:hypothetical protein
VSDDYFLLPFILLSSDLFSSFPPHSLFVFHSDLLQTLEGRVSTVFERAGIKKVLAECRASPNSQVKDIADWTQGLLKSFK